MRIGTNELLIILLVALVIFGPKQLPKLGKAFGKTMKSFQAGMEDSGTDDPDKAEDTEKSDAAAASESGTSAGAAKQS